MKPADVARVLVEVLPDAVCVSALGTATSALRLASQDGPHLYFGAAMGSALPCAMGVAEAVPDTEVVALLGDGELLMGTGALWSLAAYRPRNLLVVVLADGAYSITGGQELPRPPRFVEAAAALGDLDGSRAANVDDLADAIMVTDRPGVVEAVVDEPGWPGPSAFVEPARVRVAFEQRVVALSASAREGTDDGAA